MFTYGYKTKFSSILRALASIAIGLVMVIGTDATTSVVRIIASFLFAAGLVSFLYGYLHRRTGALSLMLTNAIVDMALGLLLFFCPQLVTRFVTSLIGLILIALGVLQSIVLLGTLRLLGTGLSSLILSLCAIIGGILLLMNPFGAKLMTILSGCLLILYGLSELLSTWQVSKAKEAYEIRYSQEPPRSEPESGQVDAKGLADAKEVHYEKVDDRQAQS